MLFPLRRFLGILKNFSMNLPYHFRYEGKDFPSITRRIAEQFVLLLKNAVTAQDYYLLGLYKKDLSWIEKRAYLGHYMIKRTYTGINSVGFSLLTRDKTIFQVISLGLNVPVTDIFATYGRRAEIRPWSVLLSEDDLIQFLRKPGTEQIFIKPDNLQRGHGTLALGKRFDENSWKQAPSGKLISMDEVLNHFKDHSRVKTWIFQRLIKPMPFTERIVPGVVCTVRIVTLVINGNGVILYSIVRFGDGKTAADNYDGAGVVAQVDVESGCIGDTVVFENGLPLYGKNHVHTGVKITGEIIPDWDMIKAAVSESALKYSWFNCLGWDVALAADGPIILEANSMPGFYAFQVTSRRGLLEGPLGRLLSEYSGLSKSGISPVQSK